MAYNMKKLPAPGRYNQKGNQAPSKFIGAGGMIRSAIGLVKGFADKDLKGQGFKARAGNALKTSANAALGTDVFETQDMAAAAAGGEGVEELTTAVAELTEKVDKNSYDISTLGSGAGSGLTYKGRIRDQEVIAKASGPLAKTGCSKKY
jgi:hypothetical protein